MAHDSRKPERYVITGARTSRRALIDARQRSYLIKMGIRTVCFLLAVIVFRGWLRWVAIAAAIVLPYASVIGANAVLPRSEERPPFFVPDHDRALGPGESTKPPD